MPWTENLANLEGQRFGTLYVDPPWPYRYTHIKGAAAKHYQAMPLEAIAALPVANLAATDSHLHLWSTVPFLPEALALMAAWGFTYKSQLVWCKKWGNGHYWHVCHEILLLGIQGK